MSESGRLERRRGIAGLQRGGPGAPLDPETEMNDHGISLNRHCPCQQTFCPIRGNCVLCVQNHLEHRRHIPECFQDVLRDSVRALADKMELRTEDARPDDAFWQKQAETGFLARSMARHAKPDSGD